MQIFDFKKRIDNRVWLIRFKKKYWFSHFRPKASAHRYRSPHTAHNTSVLASDSGQPYAGEWTKCWFSIFEIQELWTRFSYISKSTEGQRGSITANSLLAEGSLSCGFTTVTVTTTILLSEWVTPGDIYCNTEYEQSQGRRPLTLKCIGSISKGDIEPQPSVRN